MNPKNEKQQPPAPKPGPELVNITINGKDYPVRPGNHPVAQLRTIPTPNIPPEDNLCQMIDGDLKPLDNHGRIDIKGGEVFASNCPSGGAS